jgi:hypothetical protein
VDIFVKDLGLVLDTARATKFPLPLASTAHQMFMQASTAGYGREDDAAGDQDLSGHPAAAPGRRPAIAGSRWHTGESPMDDEVFNMSLRKFLKMVGVSSQREIEQAVAKAMEQGGIKGSETLPATMTLSVPGVKLQVSFDGELKLQ